MKQTIRQDDLETWEFLVEHGLVVSGVQDINAQPFKRTSTIFSLSGILYAIPSDIVCGIQSLKNYQPVPFAQPCIVGVINVQGKIIGIFDMRSLITPIHEHPSPDSVLLVLRLQGVDIALVADRIFSQQDQLNRKKMFLKKMDFMEKSQEFFVEPQVV